MGQEAGNKGAVAVGLQPTIPKSDRLLDTTPALCAILTPKQVSADYSACSSGIKKPATKAGIVAATPDQDDIAGTGHALTFWFQGAFASSVATPQLLVMPA